jgi:serine/threonine protein kinase
MLNLRRASDLKPITLDPNVALGAGGEGSVFEAGNYLAAKIYRKPSKAVQLKLKAMLSQNVFINMDSSIAWPVDLLLDEADQIVGYLMPQVVAARPLVDYYNPKTRLGFSPFFSYRDLHRTARDLSAAVESLHIKGYVIGDLNESNILVTKTAQVTLVDADSIQVIDGETLYRCRVGKAEFMPPELQGQLLSEVTRTKEQDNFALAILIFQTLMEGSHPFAGIYTGEGEPPSLAARISAGHFPYSKQTIPYRPSPFAPPITILHPILQEYFQRCFVDSQQSLQTRPTASQWQQALTIAEQELRTCKINPGHFYGSHLDTCPWCYRKALLKDNDPFPEKFNLPKTTLATVKSKKLSEFGILFGISIVFIAAMVLTLWLGKPNDTSYLIGSFQSEKLQITFCKDGNSISFPEIENLEFLQDFKPYCSPSQFNSLGSIYNHTWPQSYQYEKHTRSDNTVTLNASKQGFGFSAKAVLSGNALSPNGLYFASLLNSNNYNPNQFNSTRSVLIFSARSKKLLRKLDNEVNQIYRTTLGALAFSPDSKMLAVSQSPDSIRIYNVDSGEIISEIHIPEVVDGLRFVNNGSVLLISDPSIKGYRLVNIHNSKIIRLIQNQGSSQSAITFSNDGKLVALITSGDNQIIIYDTLSGNILKTLSASNESFNYLIFSKDSKKIAVSDANNTVRVYDLKL